MSEVFSSAARADSGSSSSIALANGLTRDQLGVLIASIVNHALNLQRLSSMLIDDVGDRGEGIPDHVRDAMDAADMHAACVGNIASQVGWMADEVARACGMPLHAFARNVEGWLLPPAYHRAAQDGEGAR